MIVGPSVTSVWPISGQFFTEHQPTAGSHPSYPHENPRVQPPALRSLQKPHEGLTDVGCDELEPQLCGPELQEVHLLLAVSLFVVLLALVDVRVSPGEQSIHQPGEFVSHGGDRFGGAEFATEATILGAEVTLAPQQRGGRQA